MACNFWRPEDEQTLRDCVTGSTSLTEGYRAAGQRLGRSADSCRNKWQSMKGAPQPAQTAAVDTAPKEPIEREAQRIMDAINDNSKVPVAQILHDFERDDPEEILRQYIEENERDIERHSKMQRVQVSMKHPHLDIAFVSDMHIQRGRTNLRQMTADIDIIAKTPGLYVAILGDFLDNHIKHMGAVLARKGSIKVEYIILQLLLRRMKHKIIACVAGNHDNWTPERCGVDVLGMIFDYEKINYCGAKMKLHLDVSGTPFMVYGIHQGRFNSQFTPTHSIWQHYRTQNRFDVGAMGHTHDFEISQRFMGDGHNAIALRCGSYQVNTPYGDGFDYPDSAPYSPVVRFRGAGKKSLHPYANLTTFTKETT